MNAVITGYTTLALAIVFEVIGTAFLQKSAQFTKLIPTLAMAAMYAGSFYFLTQALKTLPLGIAYAIWGGLGIVLTALVGVFIFRQALDFMAMVGIAMIVGGVLVINLLSNSTSH